MENKYDYFKRCKKRIEESTNIIMNYEFAASLIHEIQVDDDLLLNQAMYVYFVSFKSTPIPLSGKEAKELYDLANARRIELERPKKELEEKLGSERIANLLSEL